VFKIGSLIFVLQGQYYLVWDSYYTIGQGLKVLHKIRSQLQKLCVRIYRRAMPNCPCTY